MEFKSLKFDAGMIDPDERTFEGYAAAYGNADSDNDIIEQGAFAKSIKEGFPSKSIKVLWQHDARQPIGLPVEMREDSRGLWVKSRISKTAKGDEAIEFRIANARLPVNLTAFKSVAVDLLVFLPFCRQLAVCKDSSYRTFIHA